MPLDEVSIIDNDDVSIIDDDVSIIDDDNVSDPATRFAFPPLSPLERVETRGARAIVRGRKLVRLSAREHWLSSKRSRTSSGTGRGKLLSVPEDAQLNSSKSEHDIPNAQSKEFESSVFEIPSNCSLAWDDSVVETPAYFSTPRKLVNTTTSTNFSVTVSKIDWPGNNQQAESESESDSEYKDTQPNLTIEMAPPGSSAHADSIPKKTAAAAAGPSIRPDLSNDDLKEALEMAIMYYQDDYDDLNPEECDSSSLTNYLEAATEHKLTIQEAIFKLGRAAMPGFDELKDAGNKAKRGLIQFIRSGQKVQAEREQSRLQRRAEEQVREHELEMARQATAAATAAAPPVQQPVAQPPPPQRDREVRGSSLKEKRVTNNTDNLIIEVQNLTTELDIASSYKPDTNQEYSSFLQRIESLILKAKSLKLDCSQLIGDAMDVGMEVRVQDLDNAFEKLKTTERTAIGAMQDLKDSFGPVKVTNSSEVPAPKFSGRPGDGLDFYSFHKEFGEYSDTKVGWPKAELLRVLIHKCLEGPAKTMCVSATSVTDAMDRLKTNYGNVRYLYQTKVGEITALGPCKGTNLQKREWGVEVRHKLTALVELCTDHNLLSTLYHSDVRAIVENNLPADMRKDFLELCMNSDDADYFTEEQLFTELHSYLDTVVKNFTFMVNHEVNHGRNLGPGENRNSDRTQPKPSQNKPVQGKGNQRGKTFSVVDDGVKKKDKKPRGKRVKKEDSPSTAVHVSAKFKDPADAKCAACEGSHTHIFYCPEYTKTTSPKVRRAVCYKAKICFRCLRQDSGLDMKDRPGWFKSHEPQCQSDWVCNVGPCEKKEKKDQFHFLMCLWHTDENKLKEADFLKWCDNSKLAAGISFFHCIPASFNTMPVSPQPFLHQVEGFKIEPDVFSPPIFMLQNYTVNDRQLLIFYDSGCMTCCISDRASSILESVTVRPGPSHICVAGGGVIEIEGGDEQIMLKMTDKKRVATITGLKMSQVTTPFPKWDVATAWKTITEDLFSTFPALKDNSNLPKPPAIIGGEEVDIILGIKYAKYYPILLYTLPSGLNIYKAQFEASNGEDCVLGGPHEAWRHCVEASHHMGARNFLTAETRALFFMSNALNFSNHALQHDPDELPEDDLEEDSLYLHDDDQLFETKQKCWAKHCDKHKDEIGWIIPPTWLLDNFVGTSRATSNRFMEGELAGADITYRCPRCRNCHRCRDGERLESASLKEEAEQVLIEELVEFLPDKSILQAKLPFIQPPEKMLTPNRRIAEKILESQLRMTTASEEMRLEVMASHEKLRSKGHVVLLTELSIEEQNDIKNNPEGTYYIPWRVVHKPGSISTPTRMVFDASSKSPGAESLNGILAKGMNNLANLSNKLIKFRCKPSGFAADVKMAYNGVKLHPDHLKHQLYVWKEDLDPHSPTVTMVVKTIIYGVRPSGNQLSAGFEKLADYVEEHHPVHTAGARALTNSSYVDDILNPAYSLDEAKKTADSLAFTLGLAGMSVKGFSYPHQPPPADVSTDGETIGLMGHVWRPEEDTLSPDIKPVFFGRAKRGKLPTIITGDFTPALKEHFTRRVLLGKVNAVYDPIGLLTPVTSRFKLDLSELCLEEKLDWDDQVPDRYLETWIKNVNDIQRLREIRFRRTIIPPDAADTKVNLIVSCDASKDIAISCVHARVRRKNGEFSCQLLTAKSKIVKQLTVPKAEMRAAVMSAVLGHTSKFNLENQYEGATYVTDSSIVLYWLSSDQRVLQTLVRNAVIEIRRFTDMGQWYHVSTDLNVADIGTRSTEPDAINLYSDWQHGKEWMKGKQESFPLKTVDELTLSNEENRLMKAETKIKEILGVTVPIMTHRSVEYYSFSQYLLDPMQFDWYKCLRIMGLVLKAVCRMKPNFKPLWFPPEIEKSPDPDANFAEEKAFPLSPTAKICQNSVQQAESNSVHQPDPNLAVEKAFSPSATAKFSQNFAQKIEPNSVQEPDPNFAAKSAFSPSATAEIFENSVQKPISNSVQGSLPASSQTSVQGSTLSAARAQLFPLPSESDINRAENYFFYKATEEIKKFGQPKELKENVVEINKILHYAGRIVDSTQIECEEDPFFDIQPLKFVRPVVDRYSPVAYSVMLHAHARLARHKGVNFTLRESRTVAYTIRGRDLANEIDANCRKCKIFKSRLLKVELGKIHESRITIQPPFYTSQCDIFGPIDAACEHQHRSKVKIYGVVFKCPATCAVAIYTMQSYSTDSFLQSYTRFASRYGHPSHLQIDQGSQLMAACKNMQICILDVAKQLATHKVGVSFTTCPVSGHNFHGQVERCIKEIKSLFSRVFAGLRLDILSYETAFSWIASELNNMPIMLGSRCENLEYADLITPSRILLGRNNRNALTGYARTAKPSRLIKQMDEVYSAWWQAWYNQKLTEFVPQPNLWPQTSYVPQIGDIVMYVKAAPEQHFGETVWKIGRIVETPVSQTDAVCRTVVIEYKNHNENKFRTTTRAVRSITVVHSEDSLDIVQQLEASKLQSNVMFVLKPDEGLPEHRLPDADLAPAPSHEESQVSPLDIVSVPYSTEV